MKISRSLTAAAGLFLFGCTQAFAEAPRGSAASFEIDPGKSMPHAAWMPDMNAFEELDASRDGFLTPNELDPEFCAQFDVVDGNNDGMISPLEYQIHAQRRSLMSRIVQSYMLRTDKDRDGLLARNEFRGRPAAFVWADQDENNVLHHEELMRLIGSEQTFQYDVKTFFKAHDLDSDGTIVIDEWKDVEDNLDLFRQMDSDGNAVLMPDEAFWFLYRYERRIEPRAIERVEEVIEEKFVPSTEGQG